MYNRTLNINLPARQSAFLWGARKTGKSTFLRSHFPNSLYIDLLKSDAYLTYTKSPHIFREEILGLTDAMLAGPIIVDEVQRVPELLHEIHWLIENSSANFIMCGSSARKLKNQSVNLLGGRAWSYYFYPLTYQEITDFDLLQLLNRGALPSHYTSTQYQRSLKAYINDYLTEEIKREGLVRNLPAFSRFIDTLRFSLGELVNYSNIAREVAVDSKTIKEYYQILLDTLVGYYIWPFKDRQKRNLISATPKFYLFDVGLVSYLSKYKLDELKGPEAGKVLESYIAQELIAYKNLAEKDFEICYYRTITGQEVDFILGESEVAVEVKISNDPRNTELKGLTSFAKQYNTKKNYVVCNVQLQRKVVIHDVEVYFIPIEMFLQKLWQGEII